MKNINILKALTGILFVAVLVVGATTFVPVAHAQSDGGDYSGDCCGYDYYDTATPSYSTPSYDYYDTATPSYSTPSYDYYDTATSNYSTPSYDTSGYSGSGYSSGGYSSGGYSSGGYSTPTYRAPTYSVPTYSTPTYSYSTPGSSVYAPSNTNINNNSCTGNSCNTNITNPAPVINNVVTYPPTQTTQTQYCAQGYYGTYPNCYLNQQPVYQQPVVYQQAPVAYNAATPYVSLTQVPYTGLDLGFWGTIAYWGFMVGFALVVAYLIAIKRVQNRIASKLKYFLFGSADEEETPAVVATHAHAPVPVVSHAAQYETSVQTSEDTIDSFILAQVNRPRHA